MKSFNEMTQEEINKLTVDEFLNISPFEKKSCYDCKFLKSYVTVWCKNKEAIKARGTSIPGCTKCPFWQPNWDWIDKKYHHMKPKKVKMKCYLSWSRFASATDYPSRKITSIPITGGIYFSWNDYSFQLHSDQCHYPKGKKEGDHKFTVGLHLMWWGIKIIFYKPKTILQ